MAVDSSSSPEIRKPTKEELAQLLREFPTWAHAEVYYKDQLEQAWVLVERYCENFAQNDWRVVLRRGDETLEFSVDEIVYRAFEKSRLSN